MSETRTLIGYAGRTVGREELALVPTPPATETHRPVPHHEIVKALIETGFATSESCKTNMRSRRMVRRPLAFLISQLRWKDAAFPSDYARRIP
jgi:hypothetical protein